VINGTEIKVWDEIGKKHRVIKVDEKGNFEKNITFFDSKTTCNFFIDRVDSIFQGVNLTCKNKAKRFLIQTGALCVIDKSLLVSKIGIDLNFSDPEVNGIKPYERRIKFDCIKKKSKGPKGYQ
jgi:hypothetical protein